MHPAVAITAALAGIFTLAIIATLVSKNAQTGSVFTSAGTALAAVINAATSPVNGTQLGNTNAILQQNPLQLGQAG